MISLRTGARDKGSARGLSGPAARRLAFFGVVLLVSLRCVIVSRRPVAAEVLVHFQRENPSSQKKTQAIAREIAPFYAAVAADARRIAALQYQFQPVAKVRCALLAKAT